MLTNLLSNAVRYTPSGRILLGCGETPADQATAARYLLASLPVSGSSACL